MLVDYSGSEDEAEQVQLLPARLKVSAAPPVDTTGLILNDDKQVVAAANTVTHRDLNARNVFHNPTADELYAPVIGPQTVTGSGGVLQRTRNHRAGHVEEAHLSSYTFEQQFHTHNVHKFSYDPGAIAGVVGDLATAAEHHEDILDLNRASKRPRTAEEKERERAKRERLEAENAAVDPGQAWKLTNKTRTWMHKEREIVGLSEEEQAQLRAAMGKEDVAEAGPSGDKSVFHAKSETDTLGRSWMEPPKDLKRENEAGCYLPKKLVATWAGHQKGVQAARFFPGSGHLLLTAGMDGKTKIWDVYNNQRCFRTYMGHEKAIRDIQFSNDGRRFITSSFDKNIKVWDTETGQVIRTLTTGKICFVVTLHPDDDKQNVLLAGCSDRKVYQWDLDTGDMIQTYDRHLSAVNTITFVNNNRSFVTTSDDKTIRVWEYGIPEQIKYIADPSMHSMPYVAKHPNGKWLLAQSMDNSIQTYGCLDRFSRNNKKTFKGHSVAGYACQVGMSPDGKYVYSGDGDGKAYFWDWKTTKISRSMKAHDSPCIGVQWHPLETSKVVTCSWSDPIVKYWD